MTVHPWAVGDRVSWMGGTDYGRTDARWHGRIVRLGLAVPNGAYERRNVGLEDEYLAEVGPRDPAAEVEADWPQHDKPKPWPGIDEPIIVRLTDLRPELTP